VFIIIAFVSLKDNEFELNNLIYYSTFPNAVLIISNDMTDRNVRQILACHIVRVPLVYTCFTPEQSAFVYLSV